ncbi:MAG: RNA polymerase sigma factor [Gammaproteobacteria bacterium]|nr:RNA polymerase sigma factor [Gammaproteobacteria bacterium]NVK87313.1 RNA polymerase sigma factor [Gammaproteobacteria bacterium]
MLFNESDQHLIDKAMSGSERAWVKLVRRHESRVYNYCLRLCGSSSDAMDLMQEVFLAVYRNLPSFRGQSQFITWLFRIAANKATDWLRSRHRVPTTGAEEIHPHHSVTDSSPQHEVQAMQGNAKILATLGQLPQEQRQVVELKFFQNFTFDEIANQIGVSPNTVKTRLYAALKKLKGHLEVQNVV